MADSPIAPCPHAVWSYTSGKTPTGYWSRPTTCDCEWPESERPVVTPQAPRRRRVRRA